MLAEAGFKWIRTDFSWASSEREKGVYDFSEWDTLVAAMEGKAIKPIAVMPYSNKFYDEDKSPVSAEGVAAFARWAAAAVTHFKGHAIVWEMYNEPNGVFWKPSADSAAYIRLARATATAIHAVDPEALVVGPATSTIDFPFLEACFKAGCLSDWAGVTVHPYRRTPPETVGDEYIPCSSINTFQTSTGPVFEASKAWASFS